MMQAELVMMMLESSAEGVRDRSAKRSSCGLEGGVMTMLSAIDAFFVAYQESSAY